MLDSAPVRTLWRHFLARYLVYLTAVLSILVLLVLLIEVLLDVDRLVESEAGLSTLLLKLVSSYLLQYLVPSAGLVAAFAILATAARAREITALKAGGVSPLIAVVPVVAVAALLSAATFLMGDTVMVTASRAWNRLTHADTEVAVRQGRFWYHKGRFIYNFGDTEDGGATVYGVTVFELDDRGRLVRRIEAERASVKPQSRWVFEDATVYRFHPDRPAAAPRIRQGARLILALDREPDQALLRKEVAALSIEDLRNHVRSRLREGRDVTRANALLQARLADPFTVLVLALLAIPIGMRVEQTRSLARGSLQIVMVMFLYYFARETAATLAFEGLLPAPAPWGVVLAAGTLGGVGMARVPR
jgi:lipopolysaccharide export LptBFGC system permease protein LptF